MRRHKIVALISKDQTSSETFQDYKLQSAAKRPSSQDRLDQLPGSPAQPPGSPAQLPGSPAQPPASPAQPSSTCKDFPGALEAGKAFDSQNAGSSSATGKISLFSYNTYSKRS
jgi:hypothetical protein